MPAVIYGEGNEPNETKARSPDCYQQATTLLSYISANANLCSSKQEEPSHVGM